MQPTTRREFLRRAAVTGAATLAWTAPTVSSVSLSTAQAGSGPPGDDGNENNSGTETNVRGNSGEQGGTSVLGTRYEAGGGTNVLGSGGGTLPKTGAPVDIPTAAAAAAGMIAGGAAMSKLGSKKLAPVEPTAPPVPPGN